MEEQEETTAESVTAESLTAGALTAEALVVFVTAAGREEAEGIARALVGERLAACCTIAGEVDSIYRWEGNVEKAKEVLMIIKTTAGRFPELERRIGELHSYDIPEIIAMSVAAGSAPYLAWVEASVTQAAREAGRP